MSGIGNVRKRKEPNMITLLKMPALFLGMLAVFCCLGSFFIRENRYESGHLGETVLFGFIAYYFLFELILHNTAFPSYPLVSRNDAFEKIV
jgi:hypothetical protein